MLETRSFFAIALLLLGCQAAPPGPATRAAPRTAGATPDAGIASAPTSLPTILRRARSETPVPEGTAECLARETTRAVIRLVSATPDCSGVGHVRMVFDVLHTKGSPVRLQRAYGSRPLHAASDRSTAGALYVAALRPDRQPARAVYCVQLPATEAVVTCAVRVESLEAGRRIVEAPATPAAR